MTDKLKLARGLTLAPEQMLQRFAILGMSGAGKSNAAAVMAEQMFGLVPWVVVDPKGDWWGLRSSTTGKSAGLDVPIFGGLHADIPLYEDGGAVMAEAVAGELTHSILDVSEFESKAAMIRFLTDFADRLYKINRTPLMLILEEADEYIPQNVTAKHETKSIAAYSRIVKRGRQRGLFTTLVAQRNSELAKSVLNQSDTVIALRARAKLDRDAVKGWVETSGAAAEILQSLPSLDDGEGWVSSPQKLKLEKRLRFDRRHTFDSGATPSLDGTRETVKLASINLGAIEDRMKETIERAKAEDPAALRKQIRAMAAVIEQLEEQEADEREEPEPVVVEVKVPVLDREAADDLSTMMEDAKIIIERMPEASRLLLEATEAAKAQVDRAEQLVADGQPDPDSPAGRASRGLPPIRPTSRPNGRNRRQAPSAVPAGAASPPAAPETLTASAGGGQGGEDVQPSEQKILDAIAWWNSIGYERPAKQQVAFVAGYKAGKKIGGRLGNLFGALRGRGLIDYPTQGDVELTEGGRALAVPPDFEATTEALQAAVLAQLDPSEGRLLETIIRYYPAPVSKVQAGEEAGYSVPEDGKIGGRLGNLFGRLRSFGFIDYPTSGEVVAMPVLFLEGR